jgi:hypothetical protein
MEFPNFENEDVQIMDSNTNQPYENNITNEQFGWNIPVMDSVNVAVLGNDPFGSYQVDEEEENRLRQRKAEEEERRSKLMQRMNNEIRIKQEQRDKTGQYLEDWKT